jgi:hypothetical protein
MKQVVWYLPSGSGGMAALYKTNHIKILVKEWAEKYAPRVSYLIHLDYYSKNGLRYCALRLHEEDATVFALTWDNSNTKTSYEYINDYIPSVHTK